MSLSNTNVSDLFLFFLDVGHVPQIPGSCVNMRRVTNSPRQLGSPCSCVFGRGGGIQPKLVKCVYTTFDPNPRSYRAAAPVKFKFGLDLNHIHRWRRRRNSHVRRSRSVTNGSAGTHLKQLSAEKLSACNLRFTDPHQQPLDTRQEGEEVRSLLHASAALRVYCSLLVTGNFIVPRGACRGGGTGERLEDM